MVIDKIADFIGIVVITSGYSVLSHQPQHHEDQTLIVCSLVFEFNLIQPALFNNIF